MESKFPSEVVNIAASKKMNSFTDDDLIKRCKDENEDSNNRRK
ncbi:hypothetical protein [Clostridium estertheticum]|nr:hypothetical protein [Clostridium estertheticum]